MGKHRTLSPHKPRGRQGGKGPKLTLEQRKMIADLYREGSFSRKQLALKFKVSMATVQRSIEQY